MVIQQFGNNLYNVKLNQDKKGFRDFISSWIFKEKDLCFIVDPGPKSTIKLVEQALDTLNISNEDLKFILLTHIHIDHAGGVGDLLSSFPNTRVICHPQGIKHLINPEKLWRGSKQVLGELAEIYGEIVPVPEENIDYQESIANNRIRVIETPGHASHHLSFHFQKYIFIGEAAGVHYPLTDHVYLRPATPPVFDYNIAISSIEKLLLLNLEDCRICYGHYGIEDNAGVLLRGAKKQVQIWVQILKNNLDKSDQPDFDGLMIKKLKENDEYFRNFDLLDEDIQEREKHFIGNSIRGITQYLRKLET